MVTNTTEAFTKEEVPPVPGECYLH